MFTGSIRGGAPRPDHPVDEGREAIGLPDDDSRVLAQRRVRQLALKQLGRASQSTERILDLVAQPSHQVPGIGDLGEQPLFAGNLVVAVELHHFDENLWLDENFRRAPSCRDGGQGAVDDTGPARIERDR